MKVNKTKNGFKITVKDWSSEVTVTRLADKQTVTTKFSDHIQAVMAAKAL